MSTVLPVKTPDFLDALHSRVLIGDGAMGTQLQGFDLDVETDFLGLEGCNEILNDTRPDVVSKSSTTPARTWWPKFTVPISPRGRTW